MSLAAVYLSVTQPLNQERDNHLVSSDQADPKLEFFAAEKHSAATVDITEANQEDVARTKMRPHFFKSPTASTTKSNQWHRIAQSWFGRVIEVDRENKEFTAIISDRTNKSNPDEIVTIGFESIKSSDEDLVSSGAIFHWVIGQYRRLNATTGKLGPAVNHYEIRFRRLPAITPERLADIKATSKLMAQKFLTRNPLPITHAN